MNVVTKLRNELVAEFGPIVVSVSKPVIASIRKKPGKYEGPPYDDDPDLQPCLAVLLSDDLPAGKKMPLQYDGYKVFVHRQPTNRAAFCRSN